MIYWELNAQFSEVGTPVRLDRGGWPPDIQR